MTKSLHKISMVDNEPEPDEVGRTSEGASHLRRYPAYKDSGVPWLGEIPAHWEVKRGKHLFRCVDVRSKTGEEELLTVSSEHGVVPRKSANVTMFKAESYVGYKLCWPDDLVINSLWAWARGLGVSRYHGITSSAYGVYRLREETEGDPWFIHQLVRSVPFHWELQVRSKGIWTSRLQLTDESFLGAPFPVPPPDEQRAIAHFLEAIDRLTRRYISAQRRLIALLTEQKQALIQQAVTRGLNPDAPLKDSGIEWLGEIPAHWETVHLKHVATVQTGLTLGKDYGSLSLEERSYLRVANVQDGFLDLSCITTIRVPQSEIVRCELQTGDILMTEGGDRDKLGRGYIWHGEISGCLHQNHIFAVRVNADRLLPEYLILLMTSPYGRRYFELTAKQTTNLASTNTTKLKAFPLLLPSVEEQKRIAEYVAQQSSEMVSAITRTQRQIDLVREYRTRLIADVVTGKLDVRGVALPEVPGEEADFDAGEDLSEDPDGDPTEDDVKID